MDIVLPILRLLNKKNFKRSFIFNFKKITWKATLSSKLIFLHFCGLGLWISHSSQNNFSSAVALNCPRPIFRTLISHYEIQMANDNVNESTEI